MYNHKIWFVLYKCCSLLAYKPWYLWLLNCKEGFFGFFFNVYYLHWNNKREDINLLKKTLFSKIYVAIILFFYYNYNECYGDNFSIVYFPKCGS